MVRSSLLALAGLMALFLGCSDDPSGPAMGSGPDGEEPVPEFSLKDVNPNSATASQAVGPRDQLERISAWYFGHAT
jgi:hypothetical protein